MLSIKKILEYLVNMTQNALKCESIKEQQMNTKDVSPMQFLVVWIGKTKVI